MEDKLEEQDQFGENYSPFPDPPDFYKQRLSPPSVPRKSRIPRAFNAEAWNQWVKDPDICVETYGIPESEMKITKKELKDAIIAQYRTFVKLMGGLLDEGSPNCVSSLINDIDRVFVLIRIMRHMQAKKNLLNSLKTELYQAKEVFAKLESTNGTSTEDVAVNQIIGKGDICSSKTSRREDMLKKIHDDLLTS